MITRPGRFRCAVGLMAAAWAACAGPAAGTEESAAWAGTAKYNVLEPAPGRWSAKWIGPSDPVTPDATAMVFLARRTFVAADPGAFRRVYVSADSKYRLWVNGVPAARGPARFDPTHQAYDTLDLSTLVRAGTNVIAAEIMHWGEAGPVFQMGVKPAFVFESAALRSDRAWRIRVDPGRRAAPSACLARARGYLAGNWLERIDARASPQGWTAPAFDDAAWPAAREYGRAEIWGDGDTRLPWKLVPRAIPALEERAPEAARAVQGGAVPGAGPEPPFPLTVAPETNAAAALPLTIPADGQVHYVVFDAGRLVTAWPVLELEGGAGSQVEIMYAEAPMLDGKKGRRDALDGRRVEGYADVYVTRDGAQAFEPFLHRTFWFVRVAVRAASPLTIKGLSYRWTSYPFEERGAFACSDPALNRIWATGRYTARLCAHESYEDCPYWEQLQYAGDTRIQAMVTYHAFGDTRLPAQAIRHLAASRLPEGLTYSRYPSSILQVIPGFSLCWVMMLDDYRMQTGDLGLVREQAANVHGVLRFFEGHVDTNGFVAGLPYWNFQDWTFEKGGVPPVAPGACTLSTLLWKGALDAGARMADGLGEKGEAERWRGLARRTADAVNRRAWSEAEGLYTDGPGTNSVSRHSNALAVLYDVADRGRCERIAKRLFDDPKVRDTTLYYAYYLHEAAAKLGRPEWAMADLARWRAMLDRGTSTWWETPGETRSDCHAWSAAPTCELMQTVLGVRPLDPGYTRAAIRPYPAGLEWAHGIVPTPQGNVRVSWTAKPKFRLAVVVPPGMEVEIALPGRRAHRHGWGSYVIE